MDQDKKEVGGWWMWILALVAVTVMVMGGLRMAGIWGQTAIEREVFESSYQKDASDNRQTAIWKAQIAEIDSTLLDMAADDPLRSGLVSQRSALRVQLRALEAN
jgi:hypothetical protein